MLNRVGGRREGIDQILLLKDGARGNADGGVECVWERAEIWCLHWPSATDYNWRECVRVHKVSEWCIVWCTAAECVNVSIERHWIPHVTGGIHSEWAAAPASEGINPPTKEREREVTSRTELCPVMERGGDLSLWLIWNISQRDVRSEYGRRKTIIYFTIQNMQFGTMTDYGRPFARKSLLQHEFGS